MEEVYLKNCYHFNCSNEIKMKIVYLLPNPRRINFLDRNKRRALRNTRLNKRAQRESEKSFSALPSTLVYNFILSSWWPTHRVERFTAKVNKRGRIVVVVEKTSGQSRRRERARERAKGTRSGLFSTHY